MSSAQVFVPSHGSIVMKDNLAHGLGESMDTFRKVPKQSAKPPSRSGSRPGTQGTARFGALSHNSFFARHNPHPGRVRHIKGLLDVPICAVNDTVLMANPGPLQFPPNNHEDNKIKSWSRYHIPSNAINVNTQIHPINTITGLQYFLGRPMNMRIYSEAINPRRGITEVADSWMEELRQITENVLSAPPPQNNSIQNKPPSRQKTQYSETTGRLIPPPSRAMSRGASRQGRTPNAANTMAGIVNLDDPQPELKVMQLLCQILQTEDINAVKQWLVSAGEREKSLVMDMIKSAMDHSEESQYPTQQQVDMPVTGTLGEDTENQDRLTLERPMSPLQEECEAMPSNRLPPLASPPAVPDVMSARPVTADCFKPPTLSGRLSARPSSKLNPRPQSRAKTPATPTEAKLKYTSAGDNEGATWNQAQSTV